MSTLHLLIVEDDPIYSMLIKACLEEQGEQRGLSLSFDEAASLATALVKLEGASFDACLLDLHLEDAKGSIIWRRILEGFPEVPIVVITASGNESDALDAVRAGAQDYLIKNAADPNRLLHTLTHAIERHLHKKEILGLNAQNERYKHIVALGMMSSSIAHEYNNLNTIISGNLELLRYSLEDPQSFPLIDRCLQALQRATEVTNSLLDFSHQRASSFSTVVLGEVIHETLGLMQEQLKSDGVEVEVIFPERPLRVLGSDKQLGQVFMNLIQNACHAMASVGVKRLELRGRVAGGETIIALRDTGCGMDAAALGQIFDPFYSTKSTASMSSTSAGQRGMGLGLSICETIIQHHAGHIEVQSTPGVGTTFEVCLPSLATDQPAPEDSRPLFELPEGLEVLVVDDESSIRELAQNILQLQGCQVRLAENGEVALARLEEALPQIIITDLHMPFRGGISLIQRLGERPEYASIPVIVMTGLLDQTIYGELESLTTLEIMRKPFTIKDMFEALRKAVQALQGAPPPSSSSVDP